MLGKADGFAADETLRLPPRLPGQGLHQSLIDAARARDFAEMRADRHAAKARSRKRNNASATPVSTVEGAETTISNGTRPASRASTATSGARVAREETDVGAGTGVSAKGIPEDREPSDDDNDLYFEDGDPIDGHDLTFVSATAYGDEPWLEPLDSQGDGQMAVPEWDRVPTSREHGREHDVVVVGPKLSGKSTLANALGAHYQTATISVDGAIRDAMRLRNPLGTRVRAALHWFTAREEVTDTTNPAFHSLCVDGLLRWIESWPSSFELFF